jgi:hypothetical protein
MPGRLLMRSGPQPSRASALIFSREADDGTLVMGAEDVERGRALICGAEGEDMETERIWQGNSTRRFRRVHGFAAILNCPELTKVGGENRSLLELIY